MGVLCMYRPPSLSSTEDAPLYDKIANFLNCRFDFNIILGDFNYPDIKWPVSSGSQQSNTFLSFVQENFLTQHVATFTRRASQSILDLVLSTQGTHISELNISEEFGSSDHSIIQFRVPAQPTYVKRKVKRRNLAKADWAVFRELIQHSSSSADYQKALRSKDINVAWVTFVSILVSALDVVAPARVVPVRNFISSSKIRTALRHKRRYFHALATNNTVANTIAYLRSVSLVKRAITNDINQRENLLLHSSNVRLFWSYVNKRMTSHTLINSLKVDGSEVRDPSVLSNTLNLYFASVFTPASAYTSPRVYVPDGQLLNTIDVSIEDINKVLNALPAKTSTDNDNLSYKVLKEGGMPVASCLYDLFALSLQSKSIPSAWKIGIVSPIHKGGPRNIVSNYRPISVTSCCCRVLERIVKNKIVCFLAERNFTTGTQHGFVSRRSTDTMLLKFYEYVTDRVDQGLIVDAVFFDFSKAFDVIPHNTLMSRLQSCGISGDVLSWIRNFLTDRYQMVRIGGSTSNTLPVTSGVIQGSVLGPMLFNIFINDLDSSVRSCEVLKYADDLRIFLSSKKSQMAITDLQGKIQRDIDGISQWALESGMRFNVNKCFTTTFGKTIHPTNYAINDNPVLHSNTFRDLGLTVSSSFSFNDHIDRVVSKAFSRLGLIKRIFNNKSTAHIVQLYKSFVRPILEYSSIIWNPYTARNIKKIESVQRRMCRIIPATSFLPYRRQLHFLRLFSLQTRRVRYQLITIFKIYKGMLDLNFRDFFDVTKEERTRGNKIKIVPKFAKNNYRLNFFSNSAVGLWNKLSNDDISVDTVPQFKHRLTSFLRANDLW